jgi:hypothetical protein
MSSRLNVGGLLLLSVVGLGALQAANISEQQADAFTKKMTMVQQRAAVGVLAQSPSGQQPPSGQRTFFSEAEVNSWLSYRSSEVLPVGVSDPRVTIIGQGKLQAAATVDLEAIAKQRATGRTLDPWTYLGGRLPVTLSGVLRTQNGMGQFDLQEAAVSGIPVPTSVLHDIVAYYSRTDNAPQGVRLNDSFRLPARIKQIEVGQGQAVVVQ